MQNMPIIGVGVKTRYCPSIILNSLSRIYCYWITGFRDRTQGEYLFLKIKIFCEFRLCAWVIANETVGSRLG